MSCKPASECEIVYGSNDQHFVQFGIITTEDYNCSSSKRLVLCVDQIHIVVPPTTTTTTPVPTTTPVTNLSSTPPVEVTTPMTPTIPPYSYYNNVQIIGPKPVYITYNSVVGPSVSNNYGRRTKKPAQARADQGFFEDVYKHLQEDK